MNQISSYTGFKELCNDAIKNRRLRQTNFLMPDAEMRAHIRAGKVRCENRDNCLAVIVNLHGADWLYYWFADYTHIFMPDGTEKVMFAFFGWDGKESAWETIAEQLNLKPKTKVLRLSAKVSKMIFPNSATRFAITEQPSCTYEYYLGLVRHYFDPLTDAMPTEYMWDDYLHNFRLLEARDEHGTLAGFYIQHFNGKRCNVEFIFIYPDFRGQGLASTLCKTLMNDYEIYSVWVHEENMPSMKMHGKMAIVYDGQYRSFYTNF
jgi:GNAT superfamily N-acetyltransferase